MGHIRKETLYTAISSAWLTNILQHSSDGSTLLTNSDWRLELRSILPQFGRNTAVQPNGTPSSQSTLFPHVVNNEASLIYRMDCKFGSGLSSTSFFISRMQALIKSKVTVALK